jgi:hypothetical protein
MLSMLLRERGPDALPQPSPEQVDHLVQQLSEKAQERFRSQSDDSQRQRLVQQWIQAAQLCRWLPPPVSEEELQRFFVEDLSSDERESLEKLPRELLSRELKRRYFHHQLRRRLPGNEFERGRPPGERPRRPYGRPSFDHDRPPRNGRDRGGPPRRGPERPERPPLENQNAEPGGEKAASGSGRERGQ